MDTISPKSPHQSRSVKGKSKKRRASKACSCCRTRKVRCDVLQVGSPCTKCQVDGFDCVVQERKRRRRKVDSGQHSRDQGNTKSASMPEHIMLHQVPHYPFFRNFNPRGQPWLQARDTGQGVMLPVSPRDESILLRGGRATMTDDIEFLRRKGAFELPLRRILDQCVSTYFKVFHAFFPVVDKPIFLEQYHKCDQASILNGKGPSILLLQAIVFTASAYIPVESIRELGYASRKQARSAFHQRVRYLHDFDYEADDIITIQALLLMSHYYPSMVEQKHTWFWVHQAIGLAQGAGLHRDAGQAPQRKLWARIWWACLIRDRLVALGTGRPMHINSLDCTVPMLELDGLLEEGDSEEDRNVKSIFIEFVRLCRYMEGVLSLQSATATSVQEQANLCEVTLQHWHDNLVGIARRQEDGGIGFEQGDICALSRAVLHLIYNIVTISLHQSYRGLEDAGISSTRFISSKVQLAAEDSTSLVMELIQHDLVQFCPTICVTAVLPPLIVHLLTIRSSSMQSNGLELSRFRTCMAFLEQLGDIYWHAKFYHQFFELAASNTDDLPTPAAGRDNTKDPLVTFRNNRLQRRLVGKDPRSGDQIARQPEPKASLRRATEKLRDDIYEECNATGTNQNSDEAAILPNATNQSAGMSNREHDIITLNNLGGTAAPLLDIDDQLFENWLEDYTYFHNLFPSA